MTEDLTQCEDVHAIHQASLGEVIPQTVRAVIFIESSPIDVPLEIGFKVMDIDVTAMLLDREEVIAFHIPVFELNPSPQSHFSFGREVHSSVLASFCFLCPKIDSSSGKFYIGEQQRGAFAQAHSTIQHEKDHHIITMFCEVGLVKLGDQLPQIFIGKKDLCLAVVLQLADLPHRIFTDYIVPFEPVEEDPDVANVIVDRGDADRLAVVPSAVRVVLFL